MEHGRKYQRIPTRAKVQLAWIAVLLSGGAYNMAAVGVTRLSPKREELMYLDYKEQAGDNIPDEALEGIKAHREMVDAHSLTNVLRAPTPGEVAGALSTQFDPRSLQGLRTRNGL